jgi:hypothetical protein
MVLFLWIKNGDSVLVIQQRNLVLIFGSGSDLVRVWKAL